MKDEIISINIEIYPKEKTLYIAEENSSGAEYEFDDIEDLKEQIGFYIEDYCKDTICKSEKEVNNNKPYVVKVGFNYDECKKENNVITGKGTVYYYNTKTEYDESNESNIVDFNFKYNIDTEEIFDVICNDKDAKIHIEENEDDFIDNIKNNLLPPLEKQESNIKNYANEFFRLLKQNFRNEEMYSFKLSFIKNEKYDLYTVDLNIYSNNTNTENTSTEFLNYNNLKLTSISTGDFYSSSIIGKSKDEFTIEDARKDFSELCNFNYLNKENTETNEDEVEI